VRTALRVARHVDFAHAPAPSALTIAYWPRRVPVAIGIRVGFQGRSAVIRSESGPPQHVQTDPRAEVNHFQLPAMAAGRSDAPVGS
jgi:hypothetical protein